MKSPVDHLFVLVLENRSFDHVLGTRPGVDGVHSSRSNPSRDGQACFQTRMRGKSARCFAYDPPHDAATIAMQMEDGMSGFVRAFEQALPGLSRAEYAEVMQYLAPEDLPMTRFLADEFAITDRWFTAIPTGTIPNRLYAMCGHSNGERDNPAPHRYALGYGNDDSIFHKLDERKLPWRVYTGTRPPWAALLRSLWDDFLLRDRLRPLTQLVSDLAQLEDRDVPDFPRLVWLEPSYSWTEFKATDPFYAEPNCDHPPGDLLRGQALIQYIYDALRNSKVWTRSALVIYYDEHGGFYDHVTPPACVPGADGFATRGPRVPAIVVSPYVERGSICRPPDEKVFDHCSVLKFLCEQHGIEPWTPRLHDDSTMSLSAFFSSACRALSPDSRLLLKDHPDYRIDRRTARRPAQSLESEGMGFLSRAFECLFGLPDERS